MDRSLGHGLNYLLPDKLDFGGVSNSVYVVACKYALRSVFADSEFIKTK